MYECLLGCESKVSQWGAKEVSACETFVTLVLSVGSNHVSCLCCQAKADGTWKNTAGTGRLSTWLSKKYPKIYETYVLGVSPHVRSKMVDGALVKYYTFREAAACHIAYVLMCARDCRPFRLGKTAAFQLFLDSIDPSYHPPHRETCNRLLIALQLVHINRCRLLFSQLREQRGPGGWLSLQLDLWSSGLSKEAYGGLTATYVARRDARRDRAQRRGPRAETARRDRAQRPRAETARRDRAQSRVQRPCAEPRAGPRAETARRDLGTRGVPGLCAGGGGGGVSRDLTTGTSKRSGCRPRRSSTSLKCAAISPTTADWRDQGACTSSREQVARLQRLSVH